MIETSPWVERFIGHIPTGSSVLDLACGSGRHARRLAGAGCQVLAVDRDADALAGLADVPGIRTWLVDLEGDSWPLAGMRFDAVVVTNYLWRARLADSLALLAPGGVLIYETFMVGQERYGRPANPDFLLRSQELLEAAQGAGLTVIAYQEGYVDRPGPAMQQAICAVRR